MFGPLLGFDPFGPSTWRCWAKIHGSQNPFKLLSYLYHFLHSLLFQELLRVIHCGVECFADSLFKHSFFLTFQVSPIFIPGMLDSNCQHVSSDVNVGGCFLGMLELGGFSLAWWVRMRSHPFNSLVLRHGTYSPLICPFVVVCLQYDESSKREFH